jgi:succinyl-diaminopimelate desuccinylase
MASVVDHVDGAAVVELTRQLVQFNTVNPPGNEEAAMRFLGAYLQDSGLTLDYQLIEPARANLIARLHGTGDVGHLVLSGHLDVVHPGETNWQHDPFAAVLTDGRLVGRGAADMKGGVAAMAVALATLARSGFRPRGDLILAVSAGEEVDTVGARLMAKSGVLAGSTSILVGEPTGLDVYIAEKGVLWLRITAYGRTAHGSMPHLGVNAIAYMARLVTLLQATPFPTKQSSLLGAPTVSVNTISGGVKTNVIADRCTLTVDMRTVPGQNHDELVAETKRLLTTLADETGLAVRTDVEILQNMPPVETKPDTPLARAVVEAARTVRGSEPAVGGVSYATDGAILAPALDASLVIFGPGQPEQAHQPNEYVAIAELEQAARAYVLIAEQLLS